MEKTFKHSNTKFTKTRSGERRSPIRGLRGLRITTGHNLHGLRQWSGSWSTRSREFLPPRRKGAKVTGRTKTLINDFHPQSPNFAPFASLREILRVSVAALPHWVLREEII